MYRMFSLHSGRRLLLPLLAIPLLILPCLFAQETTAGLQGTVKDPSGAGIAKASVEVTQPGADRYQEDGYRRRRSLPVCESAAWHVHAQRHGYRLPRLQASQHRASGRTPPHGGCQYGDRRGGGDCRGIGASRRDRPHPEQGADQHLRHEPDESAHPEPVVPERHSVCSGRAHANRCRVVTRSTAPATPRIPTWWKGRRRRRCSTAIPRPTCPWTSSRKSR